MSHRELVILIACAFGLLLTLSPSAQAQDASEVSRTGPQNYIPGVRYTTGSVTYAGWEKSLTSADPNLKRWNWSAVTSYTQGCYQKVPAGANLNRQNPSAKQALKPSGHIYLKPVHVSAENLVKNIPAPAVIAAGSGSSNGEVSGKLRLPRQDHGDATVAKSYNINYVSGALSLPADTTLASRNVHGKLLRAQ